MPVTGYYYFRVAQKASAMPDGTKGGDGASGTAAVTAGSATGYGNGGGGAATHGARAISGAGSGGVIFLYARRKRKESGT